MHEQVFVRIGKKIRELRQRKNVKLHELAEEANISKGLLSKIENGRTIPSLPVLLAVVQKLRVDMSTFFEGMDIPDHSQFMVCRKEDYTPFEKEEARGFRYFSILSHNVLNLALEAVVLDLEPQSERETVVTDGYEFKYVLAGEVEYQLGNERVVLRQGDSIFFNGRIPHVPRNRTDQLVSMLVIYLLLPPNGGSE
jgi:transcriptional regulator with XRE-family HTH domain